MTERHAVSTVRVFSLELRGIDLRDRNHNKRRKAEQKKREWWTADPEKARNGQQRGEARGLQVKNTVTMNQVAVVVDKRESSFEKEVEPDH